MGAYNSMPKAKGTGSLTSTRRSASCCKARRDGAADPQRHGHEVQRQGEHGHLLNANDDNIAYVLDRGALYGRSQDRKAAKAGNVAGTMAAIDFAISRSEVIGNEESGRSPNGTGRPLIRHLRLVAHGRSGVYARRANYYSISAHAAVKRVTRCSSAVQFPEIRFNRFI